MSWIEQHKIEVATDGSGAFTGFTKQAVRGQIISVRYVPDGTAPLDTGADVDITGEETGVVIFDKDNIGTSAFTVAPRQPTHDTAGASALYAAGGSPVLDRIALGAERIKVVVAQGGATKKGTFFFLIG